MTTPDECKSSFKKMETFALKILHGRLKTRKEQKAEAYYALRHYPSFGGGEFLFKEE